MTSAIWRPRLSVRSPATVCTDAVASGGIPMTVRSCDSVPSIVSRGVVVGVTAGGVGEVCAKTGAVDSSSASEKLSGRSEEHTSELQSLMRISYAVLCLKKQNNKTQTNT